MANDWVGEPFESLLEEDLRRDVAEDIVVLMNRGVFRGNEGVRQLAWMLSRSCQNIERRARPGCCRGSVRDGVDSYLIEPGKIVRQTIHYTVEIK